MPVDLSPVDELDIDQVLLDFAPDRYCANCVHVLMQAEKSASETESLPYCEYWGEPTRVESGMICPEYLPQGYD